MADLIVIVRASQGQRIGVEHVGPFEGPSAPEEASAYARRRQEQPDTLAEIRVLTKP